MKGHSALWAVAHEDGFQRGHLHVLIYLVNLDATSPRIEIAGDILLVSTDRKAVEELVELVAHLFLDRANINAKPLGEYFLITGFASTPVTGCKPPELVA